MDAITHPREAPPLGRLRIMPRVQPSENRVVQLWCVWAGAGLALLLLVGLVLLAGFIPPPHPTDSAEEIQAFYLDNLTPIRLGMLISVIGMTLIVPWALAIMAQTRRGERGFPSLATAQVALMGAAMALGVLCVLIWAVASFRPDEISPDITLMLNDFGWFLFLFAFAPFALWVGIVGISILRDATGTRPFPRWAGYLSLWVALIECPTSLMVFFKTGPFAYNGLMALYVPLAAFLVYLVAMSVLTVKAINRG